MLHKGGARMCLTLTALGDFCPISAMLYINCQWLARSYRSHQRVFSILNCDSSMHPYFNARISLITTLLLAHVVLLRYKKLASSFPISTLWLFLWMSYALPTRQQYHATFNFSLHLVKDWDVNSIWLRYFCDQFWRHSYRFWCLDSRGFIGFISLDFSGFYTLPTFQMRWKSVYWVCYLCVT